MRRVPRPRPSSAPDAPFAEVPLGAGRSVRLWNEDALAAFATRAPHPTVVVTSPPYNRRVPYGTYSDARPRQEYLAWMRRVGATVGEVLDEDGSFFLNLGGSPRDPWLPWDVAREVGRTLVLQNVLHWIKSIAIDRDPVGGSAPVAYGHYKPLVSGRFVHGAHEYIFQFTRRGDVAIDRLALGVPYQDPSNVHRWRRAATGLRCRGNTWFLPYATIRSRARDRPHPATFPPELPEWCLRLHGLARVRQAVDPFVGIGSSAVAAARLGVDFVGFDVDPEYLRVAAERVRGELARRDGAGRINPNRSRTRPGARPTPRP